MRDGKNTTLWMIVKMLVIMDDIEAICTNAVLSGYITTIKNKQKLDVSSFCLFAMTYSEHCNIFRDVQCGKLMCVGNSTITPKNLDYGWRSSTAKFTINDVLITCR